MITATKAALKRAPSYPVDCVVCGHGAIPVEHAFSRDARVQCPRCGTFYDGDGWIVRHPSTKDTIHARLQDPTCSRWLKEALQTLQNRDVVDMLADLDDLSEIAKQRYRELTGHDWQEEKP